MRPNRQLTVGRHALRSLGALFACVLLLALAAPLALAGEPHLVRPPAPDRDSPTPHFVTETNDTKWDDCEWASAAMLIEKWTGDPVDRRALRAAAHVKKGGSSLRDVTRGTDALLNLHIRFSPNGGDPMTWRQLLARLADGGGAVVEGAYSRMPRWFQRWDRKFAASGSKKSAHAVYVERYQPRRGRVWLMDPLGRDGYNGEWISVGDLERYSYTSSGLVHAAATPARLPPVKLSTVRLGQPTLVGEVVAGAPAILVVPIAHDRRRQPRLATVWVSTAWERVDPALPDGPTQAVPPSAPAPPASPTPTAAAPPAPATPPLPVPAAPPLPVLPRGPATTPSLPAVTAPPFVGSSLGGTQSSLQTSSSGPTVLGAPIVTGSPKGTALTPGKWNLHARVVVPVTPGRYRLTLTLRDRAGRAIGPKIVKPFLALIVSVKGPYRVTFAGPAALSVTDRGVSFGIANGGPAPLIAPSGAGAHRSVEPNATTPHVVADWMFADGHTTPVDDLYLDLAPGAKVTVFMAISPAPPGAIALRLDLVGPDGRLVSELGGRATLVPLTRTAAPQDPT